MSQTTGAPITAGTRRQLLPLVAALAPTTVVAATFLAAFARFGSLELFGGALLTGQYALLCVPRAASWPKNGPAVPNHARGRTLEIARVALVHLTWVSIAAPAMVGLHSLSADYPLDAIHHDRTTRLHEFGLVALSVVLALTVACLVLQRRRLAGRILTWATSLLFATSLMVATGAGGVAQSVRNEVQPCACLMP